MCVCVGGGGGGGERMGGGGGAGREMGGVPTCARKLFNEVRSSSLEAKDVLVERVKVHSCNGRQRVAAVNREKQRIQRQNLSHR